MNFLKKRDITITSKEAQIMSYTGSFTNSEKVYTEFRKTIWDKIKFAAYAKESHIIKELPVGLEKEQSDSLIDELKNNGFDVSIVELNKNKSIKIIFIQW